VEVPNRSAKVRPAGLGFHPFLLYVWYINFCITTIHPKLMKLVRNMQNMYGAWCKVQFISEKLTVKMCNNNRQQPYKPDSGSTFFYSKYVARSARRLLINWGCLLLQSSCFPVGEKERERALLPYQQLAVLISRACASFCKGS